MIRYGLVRDDEITLVDFGDALPTDLEAGVTAIDLTERPDVVRFMRLVDGELPPPPPPPPRRTTFAPPVFLLLFTAAERVAIRAARAYTGTSAAQKATAAVLDDWFSIIEDPRLVAIDVTNPSTRDGLAFLVSAGLLTAERKAEIESGVAG